MQLPRGELLPVLAALGYSHTCVVMSAGDLYCWGEGMALGLGRMADLGNNVRATV